VNIDNLGGSYSTAGSLGNALYTNRSPAKYVNLDLSGSTFTDMPAVSNYGSFDYCTNLTSVTIPNGVTSIGDMAFDNCTSLTSVTIPNSVITIGMAAFMECFSLTSVTIPNSVTSIGNQAFDYCTSLTSVSIGSGVTSIYFVNCTSLTAINVDPANSAYTSENGVLYNKAKTTLVQYPAGKTGASFTIPNSVTTIEWGAFSGAGLTSVSIGSGVTSIENYAFNRTSLINVTFAVGSNIADGSFGTTAFPEGSTGAGGNTLKSAYNAASPKAGTYTRAANGTTWTKTS
jgi:hypothetical protein